MLSRSQKAEFEAAKHKKFVLNKAKTLDAYNAYFNWCNFMRIPFIKIRSRGKYAVVTVDMVTTDNDLNIQGKCRIESLACTIYTQRVQGIQKVIGNVICAIEGVPIKEVDDVAKKNVRNSNKPRKY